VAEVDYLNDPGYYEEGIHPLPEFEKLPLWFFVLMCSWPLLLPLLAALFMLWLPLFLAAGCWEALFPHRGRG
jgi:hypothetical protein